MLPFGRKGISPLYDQTGAVNYAYGSILKGQRTHRWRSGRGLNSLI